MVEQLKALYLTLMTIETKGVNTLAMARCIGLTEKLYNDAVAAENKAAEAPTTEEE